MFFTENLSKSFAPTRVAVDGVSLSVANGEVVFLLGANGAGKTTTINMLLDFVTPDAGRAFVDATHVQHAPLVAKRQVAFLPETVALYDTLSAIQNLGYFTALYGQQVSRTQARATLVDAGIDEGLHTKQTRFLSKGTRQKVALAIASARKCGNIILDEPTSGLDPVAARALMERVRRLARGGCAVMLCTHDLFRAREFADRVLIMAHGRIVAEFTERASFGEMEGAYLLAVGASEATR